MDRAMFDQAMALVCDPYESFTDEEAERLQDAFNLEGFSIERAIYADAEYEHCGPGADEMLESAQDAEFLRTAMGLLTARQRDVLELRYGIRSGREHTQKEVAAMLGISQPAVAQHEQAAQKRLAIWLAKIF
jgi:RNA polymerase sigma factor (sigma-70 family)